MPTIISPFYGQGPLAETLSRLGQTMFGDQAGGALKREQLRAAQRGNVETEALMQDIANRGGVQALGADPAAQARLLGSGYDPGKFSQIGLMGAATSGGFDSPDTTNWMLANGIAAGSTPTGFGRTLAETARSNDMQSADRRYGVDVSASTSIANNTADNAMSWQQKQAELAAAAEAANRKPVAMLDRQTNQIVNVPAEYATNPRFQPMVSETDAKGSFGAANFANPGAMNPLQQGYTGFERQPSVIANDAAKLAETQRQFDMAPETRFDPYTGAFVTVPRKDSFTDRLSPVVGNTDVQGTLAAQNFGNMGALPQAEQRFLGADAKAVSGGASWVYAAPDGRKFVTNDAFYMQGRDMQGQPLPPGGAKVSLGAQDTMEGLDNGLGRPANNDMDRTTVGLNEFASAAVPYLKVLREMPDYEFGVTGKILGAGRGISAAAQNVLSAYGAQSASEAYDRAEQEAASIGPNAVTLFRSIMSPEAKAVASEAQMLQTVIAYKGAMALFGQGGRDLSNADREVAQEAFGNITSWSSDKMSVVTRMETAMRTALARLNKIRELQGQPPISMEEYSGGMVGERKPYPSLGQGAGSPLAGQSDAAPRPRAKNPQTGQVVEFDGQQWVPVQ